MLPKAALVHSPQPEPASGPPAQRGSHRINRSYLVIEQELLGNHEHQDHHPGLTSITWQTCCNLHTLHSFVNERLKPSPGSFKHEKTTALTAKKWEGGKGGYGMKARMLLWQTQKHPSYRRPLPAPISAAPCASHRTGTRDSLDLGCHFHCLLPAWPLAWEAQGQPEGSVICSGRSLAAVLQQL